MDMRKEAGGSKREHTFLQQENINTTNNTYSYIDNTKIYIC